MVLLLKMMLGCFLPSWIAWVIIGGCCSPQCCWLNLNVCIYLCVHHIAHWKQFSIPLFTVIPHVVGDTPLYIPIKYTPVSPKRHWLSHHVCELNPNVSWLKPQFFWVILIKAQLLFVQSLVQSQVSVESQILFEKPEKNNVFVGKCPFSSFFYVWNDHHPRRPQDVSQASGVSTCTAWGWSGSPGPFAG